MIGRSAVFAATLVLLTAAFPGSGADADGAAALRGGPPVALAPLAAAGLLLDAARAGDRLVCVGDQGIVILSDDAGQTWTQVAMPVSVQLTTVAFADAREGWAAGHGAVLLATRDGGLSWTVVETPIGEDDSFLDLLALGPGRLIAVGAYGVFIETADGGASWEQRRPLPDDWHYNRLTQGASGRLYLAGESGTLGVSDDSGRTWEPLESPYEGSFYGLHELHSGRLLAHGLRGNVYTAETPEGPWHQARVEPEVLLMAGLETAPGTILLAGLGGHAFLSEDDGVTFTHFKPEGLGSTAELLALGPESFLAVGEEGVRLLALPEIAD